MSSFEEQIQQMIGNKTSEPAETSWLSGVCVSQETIDALKRENVNLAYENNILQKKIEAAENGDLLAFPACFAGLEQAAGGFSGSANDEEEKSCFAGLALPFEYLSVKFKNDSLKSQKADLEYRLQVLENQKGNPITNCVAGCGACVTGLGVGMGAAFAGAGEEDNNLAGYYQGEGNPPGWDDDEPTYTREPAYEAPSYTARYEEPAYEAPSYNYEEPAKDNFSFNTIFDSANNDEEADKPGLLEDIFGKCTTGLNKGSSGSLFNGFHTEVEPEEEYWKTEVEYKNLVEAFFSHQG